MIEMIRGLSNLCLDALASALMRPSRCRLAVLLTSARYPRRFFVRRWASVHLIAARIAAKSRPSQCRPR